MDRTVTGAKVVDYYEVEEPMPYCPRCEAPWISEHEIEVAPERLEDPQPVFYVQRRGGPTAGYPESGDEVLGCSRHEAEGLLGKLADPDSCRELWRDYESRHRSRQLLDVLANQRTGGNN
jgi:Zn-finger nucleic acid-binding protein